jgi:hypothetical protein
MSLFGASPFAGNQVNVNVPYAEEFLSFKILLLLLGFYFKVARGYVRLKTQKSIQCIETGDRLGSL